MHVKALLSLNKYCVNTSLQLGVRQPHHSSLISTLTLCTPFLPPVTIPPWGPPTTHTEEQEEYDEKELLRMHATSGEEEQEDYEPGQESWQISHLVSADTFGAGYDTGNIRTGRMKIM